MTRASAAAHCLSGPSAAAHAEKFDVAVLSQGVRGGMLEVVPVIRIARQRLRVEHELTAGALA